MIEKNKYPEFPKQVERLMEAMKGIDHFKDALNWRQDHLSQALRQWIEEGSAALADLTKENQP